MSRKTGRFVNHVEQLSSKSTTNSYTLYFICCPMFCSSHDVFKYITLDLKEGVLFFFLFFFFYHDCIPTSCVLETKFCELMKKEKQRNSPRGKWWWFGYGIYGCEWKWHTLMLLFIDDFTADKSTWMGAKVYWSILCLDYTKCIKTQWTFHHSSGQPMGLSG